MSTHLALRGAAISTASRRCSRCRSAPCASGARRRWKRRPRQQHGVLARRPRCGRRVRRRLQRVGQRGFRHLHSPDPRRACAARTAGLRPAFCISGIARPTAPASTPTSAGSPTSCGATTVKARRGLSSARRSHERPTCLPARPGDDDRNVQRWDRRLPARCAAAHRRCPRRRGRGVAAVVDLGDRHPDRAVAARDAADAERRGAAPGRPVRAGRPAGAVCDLRSRGHGLGGCAGRRALPWPRIVPAADLDPGAVRPVPPLRSRPVGRRRVPGVGGGGARILLCDDQSAERAVSRERLWGAGEGRHRAKRHLHAERIRSLPHRAHRNGTRSGAASRPPA